MIAWLWARTVRCPNPACGARMPLVRSFALSTKAGKKAWVEPVIDYAVRTVRFEVHTGEGTPPEGTVNRRGATCLVCHTPVPFEHVRAEGKAGRMGAQMLAIVAEGQRGRIYLSPDCEHDAIAASARPEWAPETDLPEQALGFRVQLYGMTRHADLFTPRQLVALTTFSDLVGEARERARRDAIAAGLPDDGVPLAEGGAGAHAYADAVATYLALAVDRLADYGSTISSWNTGYAKVRNTFARQAIPMIWDFAEANPFSDSTGNFLGAIDWVAKAVEKASCGAPGIAQQRDATSAVDGLTHPLILTDPPYYDNIGYADLSDFFYVWLRRSLGTVYPALFGTMLVPKTRELVATPYRFGGSKDKAQRFFEEGLGQAFARMRAAAHPDYPLTVYYAFKQAESDDATENGQPAQGSLFVIASTGWETMLEGLLGAGFSITGTWPIRSEMSNRMLASDTNALASSIVLVCRPRPADAPLATRREFLGALKRELPAALAALQRGHIAPVDLAQAMIGPGMAIFSRYREVLEADGSRLRVRTALQLINAALDEALAEQEGDFDPATRWALTWAEQHGWQEGLYGDAETLSKAKNTSVQGLEERGVVVARGGKVRLRRRGEPDERRVLRERPDCVWTATQALIAALDAHGYKGAAAILSALGETADAAYELAYRLYTLCERKGWAEEALACNSLVIAWPTILQDARDARKEQEGQARQGALPYGG